MDKQVISVILSFILYTLFVLLPMIPAILIYKIFPETRVSASGVLANLNFKTTGAFAAYVVTVFLGFFVVQNTHHQIAQISCPVWTVKAKVKLLNEDETPYVNQNFLETLVVTIDPELQTINGENVILKLPGTRSNWDRTLLRFEIPNYGFKIVDLGNLSMNSTIDDYNLLLKLDKPIEITPDPNILREYAVATAQPLAPDNSVGPQITQ